MKKFVVTEQNRNEAIALLHSFPFNQRDKIEPLVKWLTSLPELAEAKDVSEGGESLKNQKEKVNAGKNPRS